MDTMKPVRLQFFVFYVFPVVHWFLFDRHRSFRQRTIGEGSIAREQLDERIFFKELFCVRTQASHFIGIISFSGILCEDEVEVVNEKIEHVSGRASACRNCLDVFPSTAAVKLL